MEQKLVSDYVNVKSVSIFDTVSRVMPHLKDISFAFTPISELKYRSSIVTICYSYNKFNCHYILRLVLIHIITKSIGK